MLLIHIWGWTYKTRHVINEEKLAINLPTDKLTECVESDEGTIHPAATSFLVYLINECRGSINFAIPPCPQINWKTTHRLRMYVNLECMKNTYKCTYHLAQS